MVRLRTPEFRGKVRLEILCIAELLSLDKLGLDIVQVKALPAGRPPLFVGWKLFGDFAVAGFCDNPVSIQERLCYI